MRNRALHDALRDFALESAAFLTDEVRDGAELEFDVIDGGHGSRPVALPLPAADGGLPRRALGGAARAARPAARAADELGAGAAPWLRVNGMRGEQAEPALRAMLDRLYEDATSFGFPEERFERLYEEVETDALPRRGQRARGRAARRRGDRERARWTSGGGLVAWCAATACDAPAEAVWPERRTSGEPAVLCVLEREVQADDQIPACRGGGALPRPRDRAAALGARVRSRLCAPGWRRSGEGRWGGGRRRRAGHRARRAVDARGRRGGRPARVPDGARRHPGRRAGGLGARPLRDGLRARARRRGAVRLPARAARPARRHQRRGRGQPGAARGRALRRGGRSGGPCSAGSRRPSRSSAS